MAIDGINGTSANQGTSGTGTQTKQLGVDPLATEDTFLKLFVAQLRNQDPMNPQDGTQFVAQLAQFSDLEQTIQMRTDISAIRTAIGNLTTAPDSSTSTSDTTKG